jgi:peptidoglycan biosynthesis protein MviN/MurJ (putative lipid II flippase)
VSKRTDSPGPGSLASAALTATSLLVVSGFASVIGVVIAREFGSTEETDGFFAAYGVFIVVVTASQAIRVSVLPSLARAQQERRLAATVAGFATALLVVGLPLIAVSVFAADPLARVLTGNGSAVAQDSCASALRWVVPVAVAHLFVGLAASALAALDDYVTPALGYAVASAVGLGFILLRVDEDGILAVSRGMALSASVALLVPALVLAVRARQTSMPVAAARPAGDPLRDRLALFVAAAAIPLALQLAYVVSVPFAGRLGSGAVTSLGYAYLAASTLVGVTSFSIGLVSSVPLARIGLDAATSARHAIAATWVALTAIGAAVGVLALVGADLVAGVLGDAYEDDTGAEVAQAIVALAPWMVVAVGVNVTFPLAFVTRRLRPLPWIGLGALLLQIPLAWLGSVAFELDGLAVALAVSTGFVLASLLRQLGALRAGARGLLFAAAAIAALTLAAFVPPALVLGSLGSALVGLALYALLVRFVRPRGLTESWAYLRALR